MTEDSSHHVRPHAVREALRQILLASGALTHVLGAMLSGPQFAGLSSNIDIAVLTSLAKSGPQRPGELHEQCSITVGGLTNLFDRLEQQDLITRVYGTVEGDRHGAMVSLTTRGHHVVEALADATTRTIAEQADLLRQIHELIDSISEQPPTAAPLESARSPLEQVQRIARIGADITQAVASPYGADEPTPGKATVVLCAAASPDGTRPRDLLALTDLSSGGVTMLLDRLESAGLIQRTNGRPPDRRAVTIRITDLGRHDLDSRLDRASDHLDQLRSAFPLPLAPAGSDVASVTILPDTPE